MHVLDDLVFALLLAGCFTLIVKWTTARTFRSSPALLFFALFVLQQYIGCMFLDIPDYPNPTLARLALALGTLGCTLGVGVATVLARFRADPELQLVRGRIQLAESHLGEKLCVILLGYLLA